MDPSLRIVLSGVNNTGVAMTSLLGDLREIKGATAGISDQVRRTAKSLTVSGGVMTAALTTPLTLAAREAVRLWSVQEDAMAKVAQAVRQTGGAAGFTAGELYGMASALQEITTFGDEQTLNDVTAQLLTFTNIAGAQFERAQLSAMDLATVLGGNLQSSAIQLGKALNDPVRGLSALGESGIQFSDAQRALVKRLAETGRMAEAQTVILDELAKQYGGQAAAAAQTLSGQQQQLANAFGDLKEQVGEIVAQWLPALNRRLKQAVDWLQQLSPETRETAVAIAGVAAAIGPAMLVVGSLGFAVTGLTGALGAAAAAFTFLTGPVGLVVAGLGLAAGGAAWVISEFGGAERATDTLTGSSQELKSVTERLAQAKGATAQAAYLEAVQLRDGVRAQLADARATAARTKARLDWLDVIRRYGRVLPGINLAGLIVDEAGILGSRKEIEELGATISGLEADVAGLDGALSNIDLGGAITTPTLTYGGIEGGTGAIAKTTEALRGQASALRDQSRALGYFGAAAQATVPQVQQFEAQVRTVGAELTGPFKDVLARGELDFRSFGDALVSIGQNLATRLIDQAFRPIEEGLARLLATSASGGGGGGIFGALLGGLGSALGLSAAVATPSLGGASTLGLSTPAMGSLPGGGASLGGASAFGAGAGSFAMPFAEGGAFDRLGRIRMFAKGDVFGAPTLFGFGGELGVMGEEGPEAVMPLARAGDGSLGVRMVGGERPGPEAAGGRVGVDVRVFVDEDGAWQARVDEIAMRRARAETQAGLSQLMDARGESGEVLS